MVYVYTAAEIALIKATQTKVGSLDCWSDDDLSNLRLSLKRHYVHVQNHICTYCRKIYDVEHMGAWTLDHIIPREDFPEFTFHPENLAASCPDCNGFKSNKPVLIPGPRPNTPPRRPNRYRLSHPHFDIYERHIIKHGEFFYNSCSPKGDYTIYICRLSRFLERQVGVEIDVGDDEYHGLISKLYVGDLEAKLQASEMLVAHLRAKRSDQLLQQAMIQVAQQQLAALQTPQMQAAPHLSALPPPQES